MAKFHNVKFGASRFRARSGQILLDAALLAGVELPHDCRAGRCGACLTRIRHGIVIGGETPQIAMFHACQARVFSDLTLELEKTPEPRHVEARVKTVAELTANVVELTLKPSEDLEIWPGQYCQFAFRGYPARPFSPTAPLDGTTPGNLIRLHIKRVDNGRVSMNIGRKIGRHHRVMIEGPFGHAFFRPRRTNRLVLVGTGTGFAPIWAIADAALKENPSRAIVIVTGARSARGLYMARALDLAKTFPGVTVIATTADPQQHSCISTGDPLDYLPPLSADDTIYAAGAPTVVEALASRARTAGANFHSDPFVVEGGQQDWITRAVNWMRTG